MDSTQTTASDPPDLETFLKDIDEMIQKIQKENPWQILAKKNGFDLDKGDWAIVHPDDMTNDLKPFLHRHVKITKLAQQGKVCFLKASRFLLNSGKKLAS